MKLKRYRTSIFILATAIFSFVLLDKILLDPSAKSIVINVFEARNINRCNEAIRNIKPNNCIFISENFLPCNELDRTTNFEFWWDNKGEEKISEILNNKYTEFDKDFELVKQWMSCQGFLVNKNFNSVNISSPSKYGFSLFSNEITMMSSGSSLEAKPLGGLIHVKIRFTYL